MIDQFRSDLELAGTEADVDWAACMAEAGIVEFQRRPDFQELFRAEAWDLTMELQAQGHAIQHFPELPANSPEITSLFEREVSTALTDLDCRIATNYDSRQQAAIFDAEAKFVNDHRAAFEALRTAIEQLNH